LTIGKKADFLAKIYNPKEFDFKHSELKFINYNQILEQQLVILNELSTIPNSLQTVLEEYLNNGGKLAVIPSNDIDLTSYNSLLNEISNTKISNNFTTETKITKIHIAHPLLKGVFEKEIRNFQYPFTQKIYQLASKNNPVLSTQNKIPFVSEHNNLFWIASPLNIETSNFINSPLVVPVFYNMAMQQNNTTNLYYKIDNNLKINISSSLKTNEVLKIQHYLSDEKFIPLQINSPNYVTLNLKNLNLKQGWYKVWKNEEIVATIALNYNRNESDLTYLDIENQLKNNENVSFYNNFESFTSNFFENQKINWLFKWFLALSILFLLLEIVLLKYFKI
ncbi:MAG TPA: hypothetical protein VJ970_02115, partial [Flavobacteriaceae bacterium]|nr:hypothetical protein [Flavobacteriaceae bacterium]